MPVDFLTPDQIRIYGRFCGELSPDQLARYFYLDDTDRDFVNSHRGDANRLGCGLQLGIVRFLGTFLADLSDIPQSCILFVAKQLNIMEITCLEQYWESRTRRQHAAEIKKKYGYHDFGFPPEHPQFFQWLYSRTWIGTERPGELFDLATTQLIDRKILLPGASTLARLISTARENATSRFYQEVCNILPVEVRQRIEILLDVPYGFRQTNLDRLRKSPTYLSGPGLVRAIKRLEEIRDLGIGVLPAPEVPMNRISVLARFAKTARAQAISRMSEDRRLATLYAFAHTIEATAHDDALDIFCYLIDDIFTQAEQANKKQRLRTIKDLDQAARKLNEACRYMMEKACPYEDVRARILLRVGAEELVDAMETVDELTRPPEDLYYPELQEKYRSLRRYLPHVLTRIQFFGTKGVKHIVDALEFLKLLEIERKRTMKDVPLEVVNRPWQKYVFTSDGSIDRKAYTFCVLDNLRGALDRREVFIPASSRYADPRVGMLEGAAWNSLRMEVCSALGRLPMPEQEIATLSEQLDITYHKVADNLSDNSDVRIEKVNGKDELVISPLDKLEESPSCVKLRKAVVSLMPRVDLPELLLEIHSLTRFADEFTHINESESRAVDLHVSICACLMAEACNIGLDPLVRSDIPALTRGRLSWTQQNFIRSDTLKRANACLVKAQSDISLAQIWGGGHVASVDGLRFVVPVRTINAGPNPKYFNRGRGITYYNMTSDQGTGLNGIIEAGTIRDSLILLAVVLGQETHFQPTEIITDAASYTDTIFGIFWLLGYQFCPRLADMGDARFWRINRNADYGPLNNLARNIVRTKIIAKNWDDALRLAGSLKLGFVHPGNLIRTLQKGGTSTELKKTLDSLGRINKTIYMLNLIDDPGFRRRILTQLNIHEGRHGLARTTFHGRRGELRKSYREGQEDQLGALGLIVNMMVLWNTTYMNAALKHLRNQGVETKLEDIERLSPFGHRHINFLGRYSFSLPEPIQQGTLRSLNTQENVFDSELEDGFHGKRMRIQ